MECPTQFTCRPDFTGDLPLCDLLFVASLAWWHITRPPPLESSAAHTWRYCLHAALAGFVVVFGAFSVLGHIILRSFYCHAVSLVFNAKVRNYQPFRWLNPMRCSS